MRSDFSRLLRHLYNMAGPPPAQELGGPPSRLVTVVFVTASPAGLQVSLTLEARHGPDAFDPSVVAAVVLPVDDLHTWLAVVCGDAIADQALTLLT